MRFLRFGLLVLAAVTTVTCGGDKLTLPDEGNPSSAQVEQGNNQTGTVARPLPDSLILRLTDSKSRPVSGQRVAFVLTSGTAGAAVIPDTAISDDAGRVRARWVLGTTSGTQTLEARVIGFSSLTKTFTAQASPAAADTLRLIQGDGQSGTVGSLLTDSLVVRVTDQFGNGVPGVTVSWSVTGGGSVSPATTTTDATGRAATARTLGSSAGAQTAVATVAGLKGSPVTFTQTAGSGNASSLTIQSGNNQSGPASFPLGMPLVVKLGDANGNGVPGLTVTWVIATGGGSVAPPTSTTDQNGLATTNWTLGPVAGSNTLSAVSAGFNVGFAATATAAAPTQIAANSATSQTGTAGLSVSTSPSVRVRDANGNGVQGVGVTFAVVSGGGTVSDTTVGTNATGIATLPTWTLGQVAGANQLTASVSGLTGSPVTFSATGNPGPAAQMVMATQPPASMTSGATIGGPPTVQLQDQFGNNATTQNVSVTVSLIGAGTLAGTKTLTSNSSGQAPFPSLTLSGPAGTYSLSFTASGITGVTSSSITLGAGAPSQLSITTQPSGSAVSGQPFAQQPVIQVQDAVGNPVAQAGIGVTVAITAPGTGTLSGTMTVSTDNAGMAAYTNLAITGSTGTRTLTFTASGLSSVVSTGVTLGAGAATQIAVNGGNNQSAPAGTAVTTAPSVVVRDAQNNPVAGVSVTFQVATGGGSLAGGSPQVVVTNGSGVAQSSAWTLGPIAGTNTLSATATGLSGSPVTFTATATVGAPTSITKSGGDNLTGPIGTTLGTPHEVLITDANGNGVPNVTVNWSAGGGGSVSPVTSQTDGAGHATTTRTLGNTAGTQTTTATATIGGNPTSVTFTITATTGGASQMSLNGGDNQTATVATTLPTPLSVRVADVGNNPVSGVTVTWTVISGGGSVTATSITNASGIASASWTLGTGAEVQTVRATAVGSPVNFIATGTPGPVSASVSSLVISPSGITASTGSSASTATVTARDQYGNPIQGATIVLGVTGTANTINQPALTGSTGVTTGTVSSTFAESKTVSASANGTTLTATQILTVGPAMSSQLTVGQQPGSAASGQSITPAPSFIIRDAFGNQVTSATNGVTIGFGTNAGGGTLSGTTIVSASGGVATFPGLSIDKAGTGYTLQATATGLFSATTGPFDIIAGSPSASMSTVSASLGTITASSGSAATTITVTVRDGAGNPISGVNVVLASTGTGNNLSAPGATNGSGVFSGTLSSTQAEFKTVSATAGGVGISQTVGVTVNPGSASAAQTTASVPSAGTAGQATAISVQARDQFGNALTSSGGTVAVTVSGANNGSGSVTDLGNGSYSASYTPTATGIDQVAITLNGSPIGGGPYASTVGTGPASAAQSTATVLPSSAPAGTTVNVTVQARDALGNDLTSGGATVTVSVGGANPGALAVTDQNDGTYTASYTPTAAGADNLTIMLNGSGIGGSPYPHTVTPAALSPSNSTASFNPPSPSAGQQVDITVQGRDQYANMP